MGANILTVRQLNFYLKSVVEGDPRLQGLFLKGEISNLKNHYASGHIYFTLKDSDSAINCIMFRSFAERVKFEPQNGMGVILRGRVSVYERDGQNRFYAEEMIPDGIGDIALKFEQTKERLEKEGLFSPESKRPIPKFPRKIAVITSSSGAAVRDILNVLNRRWPVCEILMCHVAVQGESAVPEMLAALERLYALGDTDLAIIGRGGGSIEDLWAFNSEELARKIYESPFPVISAVGHETDFTICDFVADLRAPTPSAGAELAVPDIEELRFKLKKQEDILRSSLQKKYENSVLRLEKCLSSRIFREPESIVNTRSESTDLLWDRLVRAAQERLSKESLKLSALIGKLDALSPLKTLSRGYLIAGKGENAVTSVNDIKENDILDLTFGDGTAKCRVESITRRNING